MFKAHNVSEDESASVLKWKGPKLSPFEGAGEKLDRVCLFMDIQPFVGPWPLFQLLDLFTQLVGLLGRVISSSLGLYLHTGQHTQTPMP
jgi:hypothetical protein